MNKKLMAAAVAGALSIPAGAAMAQTSTVQVYGLINVEYAPYVKQPDHSTAGSRTTVDALNSGASRIGFRGQEKLGGNLTAWFQCETDLQAFDGGTDADKEIYDTNSLNDTAWCDRNSALGLRGGWGNFYIGTWDSPAKRLTSATRMLNETGWMGVQRHLMTLAGWGYSHRVTKSINYDTPNFGGFSVALQVTTNDADKNQTDAAQTGSGTDGRIYGINAMYNAGPLVAGAAYQKYENNIQFAVGPYPATGSTDGLDDDVIVLGINYTFGAFKIGFVATQLDAERAVTPGTPAAGMVDFERRNYNAALEWTLGGPHSVLFGWTHAGNTEGTGASPLTSGSANIYQVTYNHRFSKRTTGGIGFITVDNGDGGVHSLQGLSGNMRPGERSSALNLQLVHTF
jgi:predicted porin